MGIARPVLAGDTPPIASGEGVADDAVRGGRDVLGRAVVAGPPVEAGAVPGAQQDEGPSTMSVTSPSTTITYSTGPGPCELTWLCA
ncbi:hypothetical protein [Streptomyces sp. NPDC059894]|uniref:hypothetical protein n=1 Tax=unclassified Streptomyces TaxID=2593676 RepID=UPI00365CB42A